VARRAGGRCEYCLSPDLFSPAPFAAEHVLPRAKGGRTSLDNLAYACQGCNNAKYVATHALDTDSGRVVPLYHPRRNSWDEHFAWSPDYSRIIGLTATGRATVRTLHLNRAEVVNLRRALVLFGEHPPREHVQGEGHHENR